MPSRLCRSRWTSRPNSYDGTIKATAHLGTTYNNRTVRIEEKPVGSSTYKVLRTAKVDSHGNLSASFTSTTSATVYAVFSGDYRYLPETSHTTASVHARVSEKESADHGSVRIGSTRYRVYHAGQKPTLTATVAPGKAGKCGIAFTLQRWYGGAWHTVSTTSCVKANSSSAASHAFSGLHTGQRYRVRATWSSTSSKDTRNLTTTGARAYLTVR